MGLVIKKKRHRTDEDKEESHRENSQSWLLNVARIHEELPVQYIRRVFASKQNENKSEGLFFRYSINFLVIYIIYLQIFQISHKANSTKL